MNRRDYQIQRQAEAIKANPSSYAANPYGEVLAKQAGLDLNSLVAEEEAKKAGFSSAADQTQNRIMRNQLEEKATRLGVPLADAYALAGSDLTNTRALQEAWNSLTGPEPPPPIYDPAPVDPPKDPLEELLNKYRAESKAYMDAAQKKLQDTQNQMLQQQKAAELQRKLAIESQKYSQQQAQQAQIQAERQAKSSAERGGAQASLKIASDSKQTGGTSAFKRRRDQMSIYPLQTTAGINAPARSVLNI